MLTNGKIQADTEGVLANYSEDLGWYPVNVVIR